MRDNLYIGYSSDIDSDEEDYDDIFCEEDEKGNSRFNIVLCEIYNDKHHGISNNTNIYSYHLVYYILKKLNMEVINDICEHTNRMYIIDTPRLVPHSIIRNYSNIINSTNYIKPEIAECIYFTDGECIAVIKTIWIRLIQRTWKKIYNLKHQILKKRCNISCILYKERNGAWPNDCLYLPRLEGMLSYLCK